MRVAAKDGLLVQVRPLLDTVTDWPSRLSDEEAGGGTGTPAASSPHWTAADARGDKIVCPELPPPGTASKNNPPTASPFRLPVFPEFDR